MVPLLIDKPEHLPKHYTENIQISVISMLYCFPKDIPIRFKNFKLYVLAILKTCNDATSRMLLHKIKVRLQRNLKKGIGTEHIWNTSSALSYLCKLVAYQEERGVWPQQLTKLDEIQTEFVIASRSVFTETLSLSTKGFN